MGSLLKSLLALSLLCFPASTFSQSAEPYQTINADSLRKPLEFLGSDALEGRGTGTRGGERAAQYLAERLTAFGLAPAGDDSSFYQAIPMHGSAPLPQSQLVMQRGDSTRTFKLERDYLLFNSGAQTFVPNPVPLVFAGYGIIAPEYDYNDYQTIEAEGKIVAFLSGEPFSDDPNYFDGRRPTIYSSPEAKHRLALSRGARGTVLIQSYRDPDAKSWQAWQQLFAFEDIRLIYNASNSLDVMMRAASAARLFDGARYSLDEVFKMEKAHAVRSFPLATSLSFHGQFKQRDFIAANVIAMLPGSDPELRDTYLLVSAHYDHLGIGQTVANDSIYNGVFDNAAGVAAVLEIARAFASAPPPLRSIIFIFLTGEEKGLLGSTYYVDHPVVPLYKTIANLNVDGIAMFDTFNDIVGVGAELSTLGDYLTQAAVGLGLRVSDIPAVFAGSQAFTVSDQITFAEAGIPAILVMEGLDYRNTEFEVGLQRLIDWGKRIYHTPFDDLQRSINYEAAVQHTQLLLAYCRLLANAREVPAWRSGTRYINQRLQSIAEKR